MNLKTQFPEKRNNNNTLFLFVKNKLVRISLFFKKNNNGFISLFVLREMKSIPGIVHYCQQQPTTYIPNFVYQQISSLHVRRLYVEMISISFVFDINVNTIILFVLMIIDGYHISYFSIRFPNIFTQLIVFIRYF